MDSSELKSNKISDLSGGANQTRVRVHNERLVLSLVRRHERLAKSEIAKRSGLSPQTVSVIMRALENDGLLLRGEPQRGKVGQPSIPMSLNPEGVYSIGLNIGRRSADMVLINFVGDIRRTLHRAHAYPVPDDILNFVEDGMNELTACVDEWQKDRIAGIGVAMPFGIWNWAAKVGAPPGKMDAWRTVSFEAALSEITDYPVFTQNDATSACGAELMFGQGNGFSDFIYFFVGTFIGGGVVLNNALFPGRTGNAGALGPMPVISQTGESSQLIDHASILQLEKLLKAGGHDPSPLWKTPYEWPDYGDIVDGWVQATAKHLAIAAVSASAIIDFEAVIIDGAFPPSVGRGLVETVEEEMKKLDLRGIEPVKIVPGQIGSDARALGGASLPLSASYLVDQSVLFK